MVRQVQVTVPHSRSDEVMELLAENEHVHALSDYAGRSTTLFIFKAVPKHLSAVLKALSRIGIGVHHGSIDIVALESTKPLLSTFTGTGGKKKRKYKITDRRSVEEIYQIVDEQSHLTFDYLLNICVAGLIAAIGLLSDSSVTVVASMLVSPLMGPIVCITFGAVVRNTVMVRRGFRNEMWGVGITLLVGLLTGIAAAPFFGPCGVSASWALGKLDSDEVTSRGSYSGLVYGLMSAVPSGVGVALAVTGGGGNALVGVAIAASLLPPIVNAGLTLSFSAWYNTCLSFGHETDSDFGDIKSEARRFLDISAVSFLLFVGNFIVIFLIAYCIFKTSGGPLVLPLGTKGLEGWQAPAARVRSCGELGDLAVDSSALTHSRSDDSTRVRAGSDVVVSDRISREGTSRGVSLRAMNVSAS